MRADAVLAVLLGVALVASASSAGVAASDPSAAVVARYPGDDGMTETAVVTAEDVASVGGVEEGRSGEWRVTLTLTERGAESFTDTLVEAGFTADDGVANCPVTAPNRNDDGYCLLSVVDGEVVNAYALGPSLVESIESGAFAENPRFVLTATNRTTVERAAAAFGNSAGSPSTTADEATTDDATTTTAAADTPESRNTPTAVPGFQIGVALVAVTLTAVGFHRRR